MKENNCKYGLMHWGSYRINSSIIKYKIATDVKFYEKRGYNQWVINLVKAHELAELVETVIDLEKSAKNHVINKLKELRNQDWEKIHEQTLTMLSNSIVIPISREERDILNNEYKCYNTRLNYLREAKEKYKAQKEENKIKKLTRKARDTGEDQLVERFSIKCRDPAEECDIDIVNIYITPAGKRIERIDHTW